MSTGRVEGAERPAAGVASNAGFTGLRGHEALLRGDFLVKRPDLQNSIAAQHGVSQGPLFRKEGARQGMPESSRGPITKTKVLRKSGEKGFTLNGQPRKKSRTSGVPGQKIDGTSRKAYDGTSRKTCKRGAAPPATADDAGAAKVPKEKKRRTTSNHAGLNKDLSARKIGSGRRKGSEGAKTIMAKTIAARKLSEGAQAGQRAADDGGEQHGASPSHFAWCRFARHSPLLPPCPAPGTSMRSHET
jgi:hypothetical protein